MGLTDDFSQKFEISSESLFPWERLGPVFNNVLNRKEGFTDNKNVTLSWLKKLHFSKGKVTEDFSIKRG